MHTDLLPPSSDHEAFQTALEDAMVVGRLAPSIFNSQPWRWVVGDGKLLLYGDLTKQVTAIDPDGRLLRLSCGVSLHHAYTELAAVGYRFDVARSPEESQPNLLARILLTGVGEPDPSSGVRAQSAWARHTDRRPFAAGSVVSPSDLEDLQRAGQFGGVAVHDITSHSAFLATAASGAATIESRSAEYRAALAAWVARDSRTGEGVPLSTAQPPLTRPVPLRDFAASTPGELLEVVAGDDEGASYLAIGTAEDTPAAWLAAGEATSAILLTATYLRLGTSPMSEVVEVPGARALIRSLLPDRAVPQLVIRVGVPANTLSAPTSPRRIPDRS